MTVFAPIARAITREGERLVRQVGGDGRPALVALQTAPSRTKALGQTSAAHIVGPGNDAEGVLGQRT